MPLEPVGHELAASQKELKERNVWILSVYERRGYNRTTVAVVNKNALMSCGRI